MGSTPFLQSQYDNEDAHFFLLTLNVRIYKEILEPERNLVNLPRKFSILLCKFRCSNFKLPIETGRWFGIPREQRICTLCDFHKIGDEFHYVFECTQKEIKEARIKYFSNSFTCRPNIEKFKLLFTTTNCSALKKLCKFLLIVKQIIDENN